jgi:hypothetical protein
MLLSAGSAQPTTVQFDKHTSNKDPKFYSCDRTESQHFQPPMQTMHDKSETETVVIWHWQRNTEVLREKPTQVPLCHLYVSNRSLVLLLLFAMILPSTDFSDIPPQVSWLFAVAAVLLTGIRQSSKSRLVFRNFLCLTASSFNTPYSPSQLQNYTLSAVRD